MFSIPPLLVQCCIRRLPIHKAQVLDNGKEEAGKRSLHFFHLQPEKHLVPQQCCPGLSWKWNIVSWNIVKTILLASPRAFFINCND